MPGTADGLGSIGESGRPMLALARRETPHTARRERTTDRLMAPPCEVALPTLEKVPTEQRFSADDGDVIGLAEILVKSDIAVVEDWKESGRDATKYLLLTLQRWIRDHGGASIRRRFDLDLTLSEFGRFAKRHASKRGWNPSRGIRRSLIPCGCPGFAG